MPFSLLDRHTSPPGGYSYFESRTRTRITSPTLWYCAEAVIKHRKANNIETGSIEDVMKEVEQQICATAPPNICRDAEGAVKMSGLSLTFDTITRGAATLTDWFIRHGRKKVPLEQATERGRICGSCPANRRPEGCTPCNSGFLKGLAEAIVGADATPHDAHLHSCAYCGCLLSQKIWLPLSVLSDHTPAEEFKELPDHCWMKTEQREP